MKKTALFFIILAFSSLLFASKVNAVTIPSFTSCLNPQGSLKVSYDTGSHGIVGDSSQQSGSDQVYYVANNNLVQCFCANGRGIQTNWLRASDMSDPDIKLLQSQGWNLVPDGSVWGLDSTRYMAKNISYVCGGQGQGQVLGLATTGNMYLIVSFLIFGLIAKLSSVLIKRSL